MPLRDVSKLIHKGRMTGRLSISSDCSSELIRRGVGFGILLARNVLAAVAL